MVLGAIGEKTTRIIRKRFAIQRNEQMRAENAGIPAVLREFRRFGRILCFLLNNAAPPLRLCGRAGLFLGFLQLLFFSNHNLPSLLFAISICEFGLPKPVRSI